jgi:hypothetical protein
MCFISGASTASIPPNIIVKPATKVTMVRCHWHTLATLNSKNIPALTMVAAWSKALTGVGAAIASVNQGEKGKWADLLKDAIT